MRTRGAASALLLAVLVLAISAAPACKTNRRDKKPNLGYRPTTTTTRMPPTTTPRYTLWLIGSLEAIGFFLPFDFRKIVVKI
jgi:hypothetical protein